MRAVGAADGGEYTYDYRNRLVKVEDKTGRDVAVYAYDGLNRRIQKIVYSGSVGEETEPADTRYLYASCQDGSWDCQIADRENVKARFAILPGPPSLPRAGLLSACGLIAPQSHVRIPASG